MKRLIALTVAGFVGAVALAAPAFAELKAGAKAPDFTAPAYLAGQPFTYKLADALKKGPVVVYFFPAAHTSGCNIEAHLFSDAIDQFKAAHATVIGVTAGKVDELAAFSSETEHCGGKFPVAADPGAKIAKQYDSDAGRTSPTGPAGTPRHRPERRHRARLLEPGPQRPRQGNAHRRPGDEEVAVRTNRPSAGARASRRSSRSLAQRRRITPF